jgi:hypothetical protein
LTIVVVIGVALAAVVTRVLQIRAGKATGPESSQVPAEQV